MLIRTGTSIFGCHQVKVFDILAQDSYCVVVNVQDAGNEGVEEWGACLEKETWTWLLQ